MVCFNRIEDWKRSPQYIQRITEAMGEREGLKKIVGVPRRLHVDASRTSRNLNHVLVV